MKKIKILVLLVAVCAATFYSCTDNNPIEDEAVTQNSTALRTAMNELKKANNISDKTANATTANPFCFDFVYPLTLSYNTNTTVTVNSLGGLLNVLASENPTLYISGISFPFQVMRNGAVTTISSEGQFIALLVNCGYHTLNTDLLNSFCFDIVFPITLAGTANGNVTITSMQGFIAYLNTDQQVQLVYPFSVSYNNQTIVIDNIYELYQTINNCDDCICPQVYQPVCVQTATGVVEFGNLCFAQCAGFSQNDLVNCNPTAPCSISNLTVTAGNCNMDGTISYPLTINFTHSGAPTATFEVRNTSGTLIGTYPLASLPLTIPNYVDATPTTVMDLVTVKLGNNCSMSRDYLNPNCTSCPCPGNFNPVCVQTATGIIQYNNSCAAQCAGHSPNSFVTCPTSNFSTQLGSCFTLSYPVQLQTTTQIITANNNGDVLQYFNPSQSPIPAFVYPITATFANQTVTITSQSAFQSFIAANCN